MSDSMLLGQYRKTIYDSSDGAVDLSEDPVYCLFAANGVPVVLSALTDAKDTGNGSGNTLTIAAGSYIYGKFTALTVSSGDCVAYHYTDE